MVIGVPATMQLDGISYSSVVLHTQQFPMCIKNGPPPKGHPANLTRLWKALETNLGCSEGKRRGVQLNIRKVSIMSNTLSVNDTCFRYI